jgi:hypothetical protein
MPVTFCDCCKEKISDEDGDVLTILLRYGRHVLCGRCSGVVIEMLKDMRLIKELDTIR